MRIFACFVFFLCLRAQAHEFTTTDALLQLTPQTYVVEMQVDLDAIALGAPPDADSARLDAALRAMSEAELAEMSDKLRRFFERRVRARFDGEPKPFEVAFPQYPVPEDGQEEPTLFGVVARISGDIPPDAETLSFFASRAFPPLILRIEGPSGAIGEPMVMAPGARSEPIDLATATASSSGFSVFVTYLRLGFEHILPKGLDHILFVLGLFLLAIKLKPLIWQVTAFTLAHTVTLGLSTYGLVSLPSRPVEILIAASIVYVAVENLVTDKLRPHRVVVVFLFGLLHGLGFAGVLGELGLPKDAIFVSLAAFNIGVELGQLAVIGLALLCVGWFRERSWYRVRIVAPLSVLIGLVGLYWVIERLGWIG